VRFARARDGWPATTECAAPSYEQQARILATLHDAGSALRVAGKRCARAGELLTPVLASSHDQIALADRSSTTRRVPPRFARQ
jgi:hypothetical protein